MSGGFRKRSNAPRLSPEEMVRQGRIVNAAQAALADTAAVREFLNSHHAELDGRPIDLAVASQEGLLAVEAALAREAETARTAPGEGAAR